MTNTEKGLTAGDVVFARPVVEGKTLSRRKGIVLDDWTDGDTKRVVVWFYGMGGAADGDNCHLMFRDELTKSGDIWDMSYRLAKRLSVAARYYHRAAQVRDALSRHAGRMACLGAEMPVLTGCPDHGTMVCPKDSDCHRLPGDELSH
jgi:hypothetical protein